MADAESYIEDGEKVELAVMAKAIADLSRIIQTLPLELREPEYRQCLQIERTLDALSRELKARSRRLEAR